jgi:hypothetical protein
MSQADRDLVSLSALLPRGPAWSMVTTGDRIAMDKHG